MHNNLFEDRFDIYDMSQKNFSFETTSPSHPQLKESFLAHSSLDCSFHDFLDNILKIYNELDESIICEITLKSPSKQKVFSFTHVKESLIQNKPFFDALLTIIFNK